MARVPTDVPKDVPAFAFTGYGGVDNAALHLAFAVLHGHRPLHDRSTEGSYFTADAATREALHEVWRTSIG